MPFKAYTTAISVGSTATIPYNLSEYREIGLVFQGANDNAPYWIVIPTTSATIQVGNVVGINGSSSQCGITFGSVTINKSANTITNVRMSLLHFTRSAWNLIENNRSVSEVWLRK